MSTEAKDIPSQSILERVWKYVISMKFAVTILVVIAVVSLLSMFLVEFYPMQAAFPGWEVFYQKQYGMSGETFALFKIFRLYDPYRSWWYQCLLGILALSLSACTLDRIKGTIRLAFSPQFRLTPDNLSIMPQYKRWSGSQNEAAFVGYLKRRFRVYQRDTESGKAYYGSRGWLHLFGPLAIHAGILSLVIGGLWMSLFGTSTSISGYAGDVVDVPGADFKVRIDDFRIEYYPLNTGQTVLVSNASLGRIKQKLSDHLFAVEHMTHGGTWVVDTLGASELENEFDLERDRGNIKDYICRLTVLQSGAEKARTTMEGAQEKLSAAIEVNHPLRYERYQFYQSSYDAENARITTNYDSLALRVMQTSDGSVLDTLWLKPDQKVRVPATGYTVTATQFLPDFRITDAGPTTVSTKLNNPAVRIEYFKDDSASFYQWSFLGKEFHQSRTDLPVSLQFVDIRNPRSERLIKTILQVRKSPGADVIWVGFILMTLGLILAFYIGFYRVWALVVPKDEGKADFHLAVSNRRGGGDPERKFQRLLDELRRSAS